MVGRKGMEREGGRWDFDIEVGIDNAAIPASILQQQQKVKKLGRMKIMNVKHTDMLLV